MFHFKPSTGIYIQKNNVTLCTRRGRCSQKNPDFTHMEYHSQQQLRDAIDYHWRKNKTSHRANIGIDREHYRQHSFCLQNRIPYASIFSYIQQHLQTMTNQNKELIRHYFINDFHHDNTHVTLYFTNKNHIDQLVHVCKQLRVDPTAISPAANSLIRTLPYHHQRKPVVLVSCDNHYYCYQYCRLLTQGRLNHNDSMHTSIQTHYQNVKKIHWVLLPRSNEDKNTITRGLTEGMEHNIIKLPQQYDRLSHRQFNAYALTL